MTQYNTEFLKTDSNNNQNFKSSKKSFKQTLNNYEYSHDENLKAIAEEGKFKNQEGIRERL